MTDEKGVFVLIEYTGTIHCRPPIARALGTDSADRERAEMGEKEIGEGICVHSIEEPSIHRFSATSIEVDDPDRTRNFDRSKDEDGMVDRQMEAEGVQTAHHASRPCMVLFGYLEGRTHPCTFVAAGHEFNMLQTRGVSEHDGEVVRIELRPREKFRAESDCETCEVAVVARTPS